MLHVVRDQATNDVVVLDISTGCSALHVEEGQELIAASNLQPADAQALTHCPTCYKLLQDDNDDYYFEKVQSRADAWDRAKLRPAAIETAKQGIPGTAWDQLTVAQQKIIAGLDPTDEELGLV